MAQPVACRQASEPLVTGGSGYDALAEYARVAARTGGDQLKVQRVSLSPFPVSLLSLVDRSGQRQTADSALLPNNGNTQHASRDRGQRRNSMWTGLWL